MQQDTNQLTKLVKAAQSGDQEALVEVIVTTQNRLFKFNLMFCGNIQLAEDLCQDTYIKALKNLKQLSQPSIFLSWLFQISKNIYLDQIKLKRNRMEFSHDPLNEPNGSSGSPAAESKLAVDLDLEKVLAVHRVLSQFEPEDRWLLLMVDLEDFSYKEAGLRIGVSEQAVKSRLFRLRKIFVETFEKN